MRHLALRTTVQIHTARYSVNNSILRYRQHACGGILGFRHCSTSAPAPPWRVLFFGSDNFSLLHLNKLHWLLQEEGENRLIKSLEVVSTPQHPIEKYSTKHNLPQHQWPLDLEQPFDLGVLVSFGHMIPEKVINHFPLGIINVHPSILPEFRGAAPLLHTTLSGATETGISVMKIAPKKFDTGPLLLQKRYGIAPDMTCKQLTKYMMEKGTECLEEALRGMARGEITEIPQSSEGASLAPKIHPDNTIINWKDTTVQQLYRQYRAFQDSYGLKTEWCNMWIKIHDIVPQHEMHFYLRHIRHNLKQYYDDDVEPGHIMGLEKQKAVAAKCKDGWIVFKECIVRAKKMRAIGFYTGYVKAERENQKKDGMSGNLPFTSKSNGLEKLPYWTAPTRHS